MILVDALPAETLLAQIVPALNELFLQRIALDQLDIQIERPDVRKVCTYDGGTLTCNTTLYGRRTLEKAGAVSKEAAFHTILAKFRPVVAQDPTRHIHIDDFVDVLHFCAHTARPKIVPPRAQFRRFLYGLLESGDFCRLPEILEIARRFRLPAGDT